MKKESIVMGREQATAVARELAQRAISARPGERIVLTQDTAEVVRCHAMRPGQLRIYQAPEEQ